MNELPKAEICWVEYRFGMTDENPTPKKVYAITSNKPRTKYYLYLHTKTGWDKLASSENPVILDDKIERLQKIKKGKKA